MQRRVRWLQPLTEILYGSKLCVIKKHFRVECSFMALRTYLDDQSFDPETVRLMGVAFEIALATLRPSDYADPLREVVAQKIIELTKAGERDPSRSIGRLQGASFPSEA
jgi:hypothetical protein